jgi:hypothetical protein
MHPGALSLEQAYTTVVRPTLEYASAAWDPYISDQINQLDKVQRRAARLVSDNYRDKTPGCVTAMVKSFFVAFATAIGSRFHSCIIRGKKDCLYAAILV